MAKKKRRRFRFEKTKTAMIIIYVVIAVVFNCWVLTTFFLGANGPTVLQGTVVAAEDGKALSGAIIGMRQPGRIGSKEVTTSSDASGHYKLVVPAAYDSYQFYCLYGGVSGVIVNGPLKPLIGPPKENESRFQIVLHKVNAVDWEVTAR